jgi:hypothetical protein
LKLLSQFYVVAGLYVNPASIRAEDKASFAILYEESA